MARRRPGLKQSIGLGAAAGLLAAMWLDASGVDVGPLTVVAGGMAAGLVYNFLSFPDDRVCRVPWWLGGCGGASTVQDTDGHSRPRRPCWAHPGGKPKRLVNLAIVAVELAVAVVLLAAVGAGLVGRGR